MNAPHPPLCWPTQSALGSLTSQTNKDTTPLTGRQQRGILYAQPSQHQQHCYSAGAVAAAYGIHNSSALDAMHAACDPKPYTEQLSAVRNSDQMRWHGARRTHTRTRNKRQQREIDWHRSTPSDTAAAQPPLHADCRLPPAV